MKNNIFNTMKVSVLAVAISLGLSYAFAWTAPTAPPPGGNVSAPINTSDLAQTKTGALTVGSLKITTGAGVNKVLTSDAFGNATWQDTQTYTPGSQVYTVPGTYTFTVPPLTTTLNMEVWGAGGGSGSNAFGRYQFYDADGALTESTFTNGGGGGGSGGRDKKTIAVTPGQLINVYVGAGGVGSIASVPWGSYAIPPQNYGANGGISYVAPNPINSYYASAVGGSGGRNYDGSYVADPYTGNSIIYCGSAPLYSAQGGTALTANGNSGGNCTNATSGSSGGVALAGTNPINNIAAGKGGGPTPAGNFPGLNGGDGKVVLWW